MSLRSKIAIALRLTCSLTCGLTCGLQSLPPAAAAASADLNSKSLEKATAVSCSDFFSFDAWPKGEALKAWADRRFDEKIAKLDAQRKSTTALFEAQTPQPSPETITALKRFSRTATKDSKNSLLKGALPRTSATFRRALLAAIDAIKADQSFFYPPFAPDIDSESIETLLEDIGSGDTMKGLDLPTALARLSVHERSKLRLSAKQVYDGQLIVRLYLFSAALRVAKANLDQYFLLNLLGDGKELSRENLQESKNRIAATQSAGKTVSGRDFLLLQTAKTFDALEETEASGNAWIWLIRDSISHFEFGANIFDLIGQMPG